MPTVTNTIKRPDGTAATDAIVLVQLVGDNARPVNGYVSASDYSIHGTYRPTVNSTTAVWSMTLVANTLISPTGTRWKVTENVDGVSSTYYLAVPDGAGPYFVEDILDEAPGTVASSALQNHLDDTSAAHAVSAVSNAMSINAANDVVPPVVAAGPWLSIQAEDGAEHSGPTDGGPPRIIEFLDERYAVGSPYRLGAYFTATGGFVSGNFIVISIKKAYANGTIQAISALADGSEPYMVGVSPDVNGPAVGAEAHGNMGVGYTNQAAFAAYDLDDIVGGATAWSPGYGKKKFMIGGKGQMLWSSNLSNTPLTSYDVKLERSADRTLKITTIAGNDGTLVFDALSNTVAFSLQRASSDVFKVYCASSTQAVVQIGANPVLRVNSNKTTTIGGRDVTTSILTVQSNIDAPIVQVLKPDSASLTSDMIALKDSTAATTYARFNKDGYFITKKNAAPADADVNANEAALWFDSTNGAAKLMVKAKQADGTVVTGSLALA